MGNGIAQVCAASGYQIILYDIHEAIIENAKNKIEQDLKRLVEKQKINKEYQRSIFEKIIFTSDISLCTADIIIEAIVEKIEEKLLLFQQLEAINKKETILASNTSSISITKIAEALNRKEKIIGIHFFNPAP